MNTQENIVKQINYCNASSNKYTVEINHCNCHPETCCCNDWVIVSPEGYKISTYFRKVDAEHVVMLLNNK